MTTYTELGQEYLDDAERLMRRIQAVRAERGPDLAGGRARRIRILYDMYLDCRATGHYLQRRGEGLER